MKSAFAILLPLLAFIMIPGCNDENNEEPIFPYFSNPVLSSQNLEELVYERKYYKKVDPLDTRSFSENPSNYKEIIPVRWDGKSPLKPGQLIWFPAEERELLAKVDEHYSECFREMIEAEQDEKDKQKDIERPRPDLADWNCTAWGILEQSPPFCRYEIGGMAANACTGNWLIGQMFIDGQFYTSIFDQAPYDDYFLYDSYWVEIFYGEHCSGWVNINSCNCMRNGSVPGGLCYTE